jgi:transcriptional regulator with XRE-family HTH domain
MNPLGKRIALRRRQLGISQEELAFRMNTNQVQISRWEQSKNDPTTQTLLQIAKALDTTPTWLLGFTNDPERPLDDLTEEEIELIEIFRSKSPERRHNLVEIARLV